MKRQPKAVPVIDKVNPTTNRDSLGYEYISVTKARRILGGLAQDMSDDEVRLLLVDFHLIGRTQLCYDGSKKITRVTIGKNGGDRAD